MKNWITVMTVLLFMSIAPAFIFISTEYFIGPTYGLMNWILMIVSIALSLIILLAIGTLVNFFKSKKS